MNTVVMRPKIVEKVPSIQKTLRLDQAAMAQDFAEKVSQGRLIQIGEVLQQHSSGLLHSVEALYKIQEIVNRKE